MPTTIPTTDNHRPVDSTTDADRTDIGPATPPPAWCLPDAVPDWVNFTPEFGGGQGATWDRSLGSGVSLASWVSIGCTDRVIDGRVMRSAPRIFGTEEPRDGWTVAEARELAAQLVAAADLIEGAR